MEYIDTCDEFDNLTGERKLKDLVHKDGDWHRISIIWIANNKGEILLQKRSSKSESKPEMWDVAAAGHLKSGETPHEAALREVGEEIGIEVFPEDLNFICSYKKQTLEKDGAYKNNQHNHLFFVKKDINLELINKQESEVSDVIFISLENIEKHLEKKTMNFAFEINEYKNYYRNLT